MQHFRNVDRSFKIDRFKNKSSFNPRKKDVITETYTYTSCLQERLLDTEIAPVRYNNVTKDERDALHNLKDYPSIVIKDCDQEVYQVQNNSSVLLYTTMKALEKIHIN